MFVAFLLFVILGICAIAIDLSRLAVGVNELQTAVDAGALRGALALQRSPGSDPTQLVKEFMTSRNPVMGNFLSDADIKVEGWRWGANSTLGNSAEWGTTGPTGVNAVRVTATQIGSRLFSALELSTTRSATAWVANVKRTCVRPLLFDLNAMFNRPANTRTPLTEAQIDALRTANPPGSRNWMTVAPPGATLPNNVGVYAGWVRWVGIQPTGNVGGNNWNFRSNLNNCNAEEITYPISLENAVNSETGGNPSAKITSLIRATESAFFGNPNQGGGNSTPPICPFAPASSDVCNVTIPVMLGWPTSQSAFDGATSYSGQMMVTFRVACYKRKSGNSCPDAASANVTWNVRGGGSSEVAVGTMLGYLDIVLPAFSGSAPLSTVKLWEQRVILVR